MKKTSKRRHPKIPCAYVSRGCTFVFKKEGKCKSNHESICDFGQDDDEDDQDQKFVLPQKPVALAKIHRDQVDPFGDPSEEEEDDADELSESEEEKLQVPKWNNVNPSKRKRQEWVEEEFLSEIKIPDFDLLPPLPTPPAPLMLASSMAEDMQLLADVCRVSSTCEYIQACEAARTEKLLKHHQNRWLNCLGPLDRQVDSLLQNLVAKFQLHVDHYNWWLENVFNVDLQQRIATLKRNAEQCKQKIKL